MNAYLKNLNRIEFVVTLACTGRCKHCQNGEPVRTSEHIDTDAAVEAIRKVCAHYGIGTVMTFGGEPLLYPDTVCAIHAAAERLGVGKRQIITNGYFAKRRERIAEVAQKLKESGVNDLRLSVDAFHRETIPLEPVRFFAECAVRAGIPIRLQPAWLVSREDQNPYNVRTKEILGTFESLGIPAGSGNVIFPSGRALMYLKEYFDENAVEASPYEEDPKDVRSLSFLPNGDVLNGNVYRTDILEILRTYRPQKSL
ncbi:MAG: radical SAM protein [Clostridia bacterium]|nr:radical SAM protein [Clostridia bacterium]